MNPSEPYEPPRIARLKRDKHGRPVPWFVAWIEGAPDFRVIAPGAAQTAWAAKLCFVCGMKFQRQQPRTFPIGPMCTITRTSPEPPSHYECAHYSVLACPFLTTPRMVRRDKHVPAGAVDPAGVMIRRNPGAVALWLTKYNGPSVKAQEPGGRLLFDVGPPMFVEWYAEGRIATRAEVLASIDSGLPLLAEPCQGDPAQLLALGAAHQRALTLVPAR